MNQISALTVSIAEAAKIVGIGRTSLYAAIAAKKLKVKKFGRRTLIEIDELRRFLSNLPEPNTS